MTKRRYGPKSPGTSSADAKGSFMDKLRRQYIGDDYADLFTQELSSEIRAMWANLDGLEGYEYHHTKPLQQPQQSRSRLSFGKRRINQTDHLHDKLRDLAQPTGDILHGMSPTKANFKTVEPNSWNIDEITQMDFKSDRPHGYPENFNHSINNVNYRTLNSKTIRVSK